MNCYDCAVADTPAAAVASCTTCGAGICLAHAHASSYLLHRPSGMGVATLPRAARRILCATCRDAERSSSGG
ncbi:DUF2180 family protein [Streptomyces sp. NPDC096142]|uniref:DUF2180 family protein n=2 Tax=unclassified Streptomyces TaxID=2593676 RepID=UPI00382E0F5F